MNGHLNILCFLRNFSNISRRQNEDTKEISIGCCQKSETGGSVFKTTGVKQLTACNIRATCSQAATLESLL